MATQTVEFRSPPSQTVIAKLFAIGSDTEVASVSTTEATNRKGTYSAAYTDVAAGEYELIALVGSVAVARWFVTLTLTTATFQTYDKVRAELDPAARVKLDATQPDYAPSTAAALAAVDAKIGTPETSLSAMVGNVPTVAEFEARTIAAANYRQNITIRGTSMTEAKAFDLLLASLAGVTSQPSGTTEKFKFLDGNDAFTTTFDTNGNRTGVSLA